MSVLLLSSWVVAGAITLPPVLPPLPGTNTPAVESEPAPTQPVDPTPTPHKSPGSTSPGEPSKPESKKPSTSRQAAPKLVKPSASDPAAVVEPPPVVVDLPPEFATDTEATATPRLETAPDPAGVVLEAPDDEPTAALPGDPVPDPSDRVEGAEGPVDPAFENIVSVRTAVERTVSPPLTYKGERPPPERAATFMFGYRTFAIADALHRRQSWHVASIEMTPLRRYARLNLITEAGWEGGEAAQGDDRADFLIMQKVGVGAQYPHWLTPLIEFQAGIGAARVEVFERNDLAVLYSLGVDAGAQWAVTKRMYLMALVGWLRPHFSVKDEVVYYDRATFKLGIGF